MDYVLRFWTSVPSLVGLGLVGLVVLDVTVTVLSVSSGPGPVTRRVSSGAWRAFRGLHAESRQRWPALRVHWLLRIAGPLIVLLVLLTWIVLMILGWGLVFGQEGSLLADGEALEPAFGRIHYAAALVLGRGTDFNPGGGVWRFAEQVASLTGVGFIGVSVAYVLPVINAVVHRRSVAASVATLGGNPNEILLRAWDGEDLGDLDLHLIALTPDIALLAQHHLAYPVITYFHSGDRVASLAPAIVVLDEALTLLSEVVEEDVGCGRMAVLPCRAAITNFLASLAHMGVRSPGDHVLPRPPLDPLRWSGIPMRPADDVDAAYDDLADRRGRLAAFLRHDAADPAEIQATVDAEAVDDADDRDQQDDADEASGGTDDEAGNADGDVDPGADGDAAGDREHDEADDVDADGDRDADGDGHVDGDAGGAADADAREGMSA